MQTSSLSTDFYFTLQRGEIEGQDNTNLQYESFWRFVLSGPSVSPLSTFACFVHVLAACRCRPFILVALPRPLKPEPHEENLLRKSDKLRPTASSLCATVAVLMPRTKRTATRYSSLFFAAYEVKSCLRRPFPQLSPRDHRSRNIAARRTNQAAPGHAYSRRFAFVLLRA